MKNYIQAGQIPKMKENIPNKYRFGDTGKKISRHNKVGSGSGKIWFPMRRDAGI